MRRIAIIGLGYVGLHTAMAFAKVRDVIGFDINETRINELSEHHDSHGEFSDAELKDVAMTFSSNIDDLKDANFFIIIVSTPINLAKEPDLTALTRASETVAKQLKKDDVVVYESTVYPGATEEVCIPILERISRLKCGVDFWVGYSPERINPTDTLHSFENTVKIVSSCDENSLKIIKEEYDAVIKAGTYPLSSIKAAEAAKVIENAQRDINIAFVNEMALILHKLGLDTQEVLKAAATKWNFLPFQPGLVGGHCIGVDPYYLIHKSQELGFYPDLIISGRRINSGMGKYIADETIKLLIQNDVDIKHASIAVLGITYKENTPDIRNSQASEIVHELECYHLNVLAYDPVADPEDVYKEYGIELVDGWDKIHDVSAIVMAVPHDEFKKISKEQLLEKFHGKAIIMDVKGILNADDYVSTDAVVWRL